MKIKIMDSIEYIDEAFKRGINKSCFFENVKNDFLMHMQGYSYIDAPNPSIEDDFFGDAMIPLSDREAEERKKGNSRKNSVSVALDNSVSSIFVSGMCFFAATIGVGIVSKIDMIGTLCTLISRGAIISMIVVICVLPSILLIFDRLIIKTSLGFKGDSYNKK